MFFLIGHGIHYLLYLVLKEDELTRVQFLTVKRIFELQMKELRNNSLLFVISESLLFINLCCLHGHDQFSKSISETRMQCRNHKYGYL